MPIIFLHSIDYATKKRDREKLNPLIGCQTEETNQLILFRVLFSL